MIILVRHAEAVDEGPDLRDEHRFLTRAGRAAAVALAAELTTGGRALTAVLSSPLVRAVQTAELVVAALGVPLVVEASPTLAPGGALRVAARRLGEASGVVMAVGHEPSISALASVLCGDAVVPSFRKAEACLIDGGRVVGWLGSDRRS